MQPRWVMFGFCAVAICCACFIAGLTASQRPAANPHPQSVVAIAEAQAQAIRYTSSAQAEANRAIAASVTPELIQYEMLRKWNGVSPQFVAGGNGSLMPFLQVPTPAMRMAAQRE